ncbi:MAG: sugar transferase [Chloroflexi bacterium]|nr:sugar transferase [Chloroflexota bacterium]
MKIPADIPRSKRIFDIAITIPILILFSPILLLVALIVGIVHGRPLLFSQVRPGYRGELFTMYKFRTMRDLYDENGNLLPDEERLTRVGKYLRASSLDELPEFFTVLRGKMSLVGPRPLLAEYLGRYSTEQARRHDVLPGITGWAQIHGRNVLTWEDKFLLDVWYVDHWSIGLDIKILFQTFWKVIKREGISQPGFATADFFMGNVNNGESKDE